jgi:hypothetical protein
MPGLGENFVGGLDDWQRLMQSGAPLPTSPGFDPPVDELGQPIVNQSPLSAAAEPGATAKQLAQMIVGGMNTASGYLGIPQGEIKNDQGDVVFPTNALERGLQGSSEPAKAMAAAVMGPGGAKPFKPAAPAIMKVTRRPPEPMPQLAENYPEVGPPGIGVEKDKAGNIIKTFPNKLLTPEGLQAQKLRVLAQRDIDAGNYDPYFDPAKRADINPRNYPKIESTLDLRMVKPETQAKYEAIARNPEATQRLSDAYERGLLQEKDAGNWYFMRQLEKKFSDEYGPVEGRLRFKERFPDPMAATTGGADPNANLMMAHWGNVLKQRGLLLPEESHQYPFPVGGRYAGSNMGVFDKMILRGEGIDQSVRESNPKRYNFVANFLGDPNAVTIDEQMSRLFDPKMQMPPKGSYGHFQGVIDDLAKKYGVDPRYFQEVSWAGAKDALTKGGYRAKPMISEVNEAIERTHRMTGMPHDEIVKRGLVRSEIPLYGIGGLGAALGGAAIAGKPDQEEYY